MRKVALYLLLILLPLTAWADAPAPAHLREARTFEEVEAFLIDPPKDGLADVKPGYIRYVAQHRLNDEKNFRKGYWLGGPEGSELDLTVRTQANGKPYPYFVGTMCTRASFSMALSYLGIDMTPGDMSATLGLRDLDPPYEEISVLYGLERLSNQTHTFDEMMQNYLTDPSYSPVYIHFIKPDGQYHALLAVAMMEQETRCIVVDPSSVLSRGKGYRVYMLALNRARNRIENATFYQELHGSRITAIYQWRLPSGTEE